jgi:D-3-phosphoglycerate dehydrogenase / 2-oxoglutarate reductase
VSGRKRVVVLRPYVLHPAAREILAPEFEIVEDLEPDEEVRALAGAHGVLGTVTPEVLEACTVLEVIGIPGSGWDHIDVSGATARGIAVVNAAGAQHAAVAEHAVGLMLSLVKRIAVSDRIFHSEKQFVGRDYFMGDDWPGWPEELSGKTIGIVGFGFIGRDLARKCRLGFDMRVLAYDPFVDPDEIERQGVEPVGDDLDRLLSTSDFVSLHLPLTDATRNFIGERELRLMQPHSYFVNLSRGGTVDEDALVRALTEGWIRGAGIDVFAEEPAPDGHPLFSMENVVLTAHIGGWVIEAVPRLSAVMAREMRSVLRGERPWRIVNPEVIQPRGG